MSFDLDLLNMANRHAFLMQHQPRCEQCGSNRSYLTTVEAPAQWRCAKCDHHWQFEPVSRETVEDKLDLCASALVSITQAKSMEEMVNLAYQALKEVQLP